MKTVSDWTHQMNLHGYSVSKLISLAQADAYNQAIDDAAKNATATLKSSEVEPSGKYDYIGVKGKLYFMPFVELESILKLRK